MRPTRSTPALAALVALLACGGSSTDPGNDDNNTPIAVGGVLLNPGDLRLVAGQTGLFTATVISTAGAPLTGRTVTWSSSNTSLATVAGGVVTAVSAGTALITATSEGKSGNGVVTITAIPVASLTLAPTTLDMLIGENRTITATTRSSTGAVLTGRFVEWTSLQSTVASVSNAGVVTALSPGTATIMVTSEGQSATAQVTVTYVQAIFSAITAGDFHTCALNAAGRAYCWGGDNSGQNGNGQTGGNTPHPVTTNLAFSTISAGLNHTCVLTSAGVAYCWGMNINGQLGDGTNTQRNTPNAVNTALTFPASTAAARKRARSPHKGRPIAGARTRRDNSVTVPW